jgi:large subunit ribosomal protein L34
MAEKLTKNNKKKHVRKHGFLSRLATSTGRKVVKARRVKGRKRI